jgi:hypothetical protein
MSSGYTDPPTAEQFAAWLERFRQEQAALLLLESPAIGNVRRDLGRLLNELSAMVATPPGLDFED